MAEFDQKSNAGFIAETWRRARVLHQHYLENRYSDDVVRVTAIEVQLQALVLLMAGTPATCLDDTGPKAIAAALYRGPMAHAGGHTAALIEHAIELDMERLQPGDDLAEPARVH